MRHILLSTVACLVLPYFLYYLVSGTIFGKKVIEHEMCVLIFSKNFVCNISHSKKNSARYHKCTNSEVNSVRKHNYNCMLDDGIY